MHLNATGVKMLQRSATFPGEQNRITMLPVAKTQPVNERIAEAYQVFIDRLGVERAKREVARRVYGDAERSRDIGRYMKPGGPAPRLPMAVTLAVALEQPVDAFIDDPLVAIARELDEAGQRVESIAHRLEALEARVAAGFEEGRAAIAALASGVEELARRLPPQAEPKSQSG